MIKYCKWGYSNNTQKNLAWLKWLFKNNKNQISEKWIWIAAPNQEEKRVNVSWNFPYLTVETSFIFILLSCLFDIINRESILHSSSASIISYNYDLMPPHNNSRAHSEVLLKHQNISCFCFSLFRLHTMDGGDIFIWFQLTLSEFLPPSFRIQFLAKCSIRPSTLTRGRKKRRVQCRTEEI